MKQLLNSINSHRAFSPNKPLQIALDFTGNEVWIAYQGAYTKVSNYAELDELFQNLKQLGIDSANLH